MTTTEINALYASYGLDPANLSPEVKNGIENILRGAALNALEELKKILEAELRKRNISVTTPQTPTVQAQAGEGILAKMEAEEAAAAARKRRNIIIGVSAGVVVIVVAIVLIVKRKRR